MDLVEKEYKKDSKLRKEDVKMLMEWLDTQPHLPKLDEHEVICFLQSCYFSNETAKTVIDTCFTIKTISPEIFRNRDPYNETLQKRHICCYTVLPQKTHEGYSVLYVSLFDPNPDNCHFETQLKVFDMATTLELHQNGTMKGFRIVLDMTGIVFAHFTKLSIMPIKKVLYYLQDGMPIRLKGLHFVNTVPFMDKILALMRPFMRKDLMDMLHLHENIEGLLPFVPRECLHSDHGGNAPSIKTCYENMLKNLKDNKDFFAHQDKQLVDETLRPGKPKTASDIFGVEGTFKKLDLD